MFESARLKLTLWYLLLIMLISVSFSVAIYNALTVELNRLEQVQKTRIARRIQFEQSLPDEIRQQIPQQPMDLGLEEIENSKERLRLILALINIGILILSSGAGYFLAGRTLRPIKVMVDDQNRFVSDASHELRTPLTALKTSIEVNLRDKKMTLADSKDLLKSNLEEVNNLQFLSDNLLLLAKSQNTKVVSLHSDVQLEEVVNQAIEKTAILAKEKKIKVNRMVSQAIFQGSEQELVRMLIILLDNAIKYSPEKTNIVVKGQRNNTQVIITVQDEGIGIAEKDLPFVFDRFYRADKSRSQTSGYGLGLSIAQKIVLDHHGSISVSSELQKGTTFTIHLPIKQSKIIL